MTLRKSFTTVIISRQPGAKCTRQDQESTRSASRCHFVIGDTPWRRHTVPVPAYPLYKLTPHLFCFFVFFVWTSVVKMETITRAEQCKYNPPSCNSTAPAPFTSHPSPSPLPPSLAAVDRTPQVEAAPLDKREIWGLSTKTPLSHKRSHEFNTWRGERRRARA